MTILIVLCVVSFMYILIGCVFALPPASESKQLCETLWTMFIVYRNVNLFAPTLNSLFKSRELEKKKNYFNLNIYKIITFFFLFHFKDY